MILLTLLCVCGVLCARSTSSSSSSSTMDAKMRNGSPNSFDSHRVPAPSRNAEREFGALFEILPTLVAKSHWIWSAQVVCDSTNGFALSLMSNQFDHMSISMTAPDGSSVDLASLAFDGAWPLNDDGSKRLKSHNYRIPTPQTGAYSVSIHVPASALLGHNEADAIGLLLAMNESPVSIVSHLNTYQLEVGRSVGLVTRVSDDVAWTVSTGVPPKPLLGAIHTANMIVVAPDGSETEYAMHDDGLHDDELANDGIYGATFEPAVAGKYIWFAHVRGANQGVEFQRTTEHLVRVASLDVELTGKASLTASAARVVAHIGVAPASTTKTVVAAIQAPLLSVYAELWTVGGTAVGWAATAATPANGVVTLSWDARWLADARVKSGEKFELRNVYISEMDGFVPLSVLAVIAPSQSAALDVDAMLAVASTRHPDEKNFGERPAWLDQQLGRVHTNAATAAPLVLVHGYCSSSNPFLSTPSAWTDFHTFADYDKSRSNDEFARLIGDFAAKKGLDSGFAGVGHSQGGIALTHLMCTYWSGMDTTRLTAQAKRNATNAAPFGSGARIVQSVGTPYKGCSGAGTGAALIEIFGYGCGSNDDLTPDGASLWMSTVSEACAADVYYYTTTYPLKGGSWLGEWCSWATSLVLEAPNDGTTELEYAHLPGANNLGNTEKQCHTSDMSYPEQSADAARNALMNKHAAGRA